MRIGRRRLLGVVGTATIGGLAGCSGLLGGGRERMVVDDFSDEDLSEYGSENTAVGMGVAIVEGEDPLGDDETGLVVTRDANTRHYSRADADGDTLDVYPKRGDVVELRQYVRSGGRGAFFWAYGDSSEFYAFVLDSNDEVARLSKKDGESETLDDDDLPGEATGQWTRLVVEYDLEDDGTITATLEDDDGDDIVSLQATDDDLDAQGIAFTQGSAMDVGTVYESVVVRR